MTRGATSKPVDENGRPRSCASVAAAATRFWCIQPPARQSVFVSVLEP